MKQTTEQITARPGTRPVSVPRTVHSLIHSGSGWNRPTLTAAVINVSILARCWAGPSPVCLHPTISRYRDTLADDIVIQFFPTIRALVTSLPLGYEEWRCWANCSCN